MYRSTLKEIIDEKIEYKGDLTGNLDYPEIRETDKPEYLEQSIVNLAEYDTEIINQYFNLKSTKLTLGSKHSKKFSRKITLLKDLQSLIKNYKLNPIKKGFKFFLIFLNIRKIYRKEYISIELMDEIRDSIKILKLKDEWDGEGSQRYQKKTWKKMSNFLQELSFKYFIDTRIYLHSPLIFPGSKGDIDLHWKTKEFELFLSIPYSDNEPIVYYGDDFDKNVMEGSFEKDNFEEILSWLKKFI